MWVNPKCRYIRLFTNGCRMTYNIVRVTGTFNYTWDILRACAAKGCMGGFPLV